MTMSRTSCQVTSIRRACRASGRANPATPLATSSRKCLLEVVIESAEGGPSSNRISQIVSYRSGLSEMITRPRALNT